MGYCPLRTLKGELWSILLQASFILYKEIEIKIKKSHQY